MQAPHPKSKDPGDSEDNSALYKCTSVFNLKSILAFQTQGSKMVLSCANCWVKNWSVVPQHCSCLLHKSQLFVTGTNS